MRIRATFAYLLVLGLAAGCGGGGGGTSAPPDGPGAPTLESISPLGGSPLGGTLLTLTGTNFDAGVTGITVGGQPATNVSSPTQTTVTCNTPPGTTGPANVTVATPEGTAALTDAFRYYAPPTVASVPAITGPEAGGTPVEVHGTGFQVDDAGSPTVRFGGQLATGVSVTSDTVIACTTPAGSYGWVDVEVTNANGTGQQSAAFRYSGFRYVAAGLNGAIVWSTDGDTWQEAASSEVTTVDKIYGLAQGADGRWVGVGGNWSPDHSRILHTDAISDWVLALDTNVATPTVLGDIAHDGVGRYVALGSGGVGPTWVVYSDDGDDWTAATTQFHGTAVAHDDVSRWVGVGYDIPPVRYSSDGDTWAGPSVLPVPPGLGFEGVAHGGGPLWVAVGQGGLIMTSQDADVWAEATSSRTVTTVTLTDVANDGAATWVAVGAAGLIVHSMDGDVWTVASDNGLAVPVDLESVTGGLGGAWIAVGADGTILQSSDGDVWTPATTPGTTRLLLSVAAGDR